MVVAKKTIATVAERSWKRCNNTRNTIEAANVAADGSTGLRAVVDMVGCSNLGGVFDENKQRREDTSTGP
jgi:hypothetical protein